ncbi:MAG: triose-phosphate isomerase [Actinomycetota bacterium]|nr:triose-phosphate isomerase [Actinomycetota bacterium]
MRTPLIAGNWKMNKTHLEAIHFVEQLGHELANYDPAKVEVVLCPPFTALRSVQTTLDDRHQSFGLGAQNMHHENEGAFTGEVSPPMLKSLRVKYVILGHSERREMFGETNETVNQKVRAAFAHDMLPIMCCGETDMERMNERTEAKVEAQIREGLEGLSEDQARRVVVAYEPIWAIGTGQTATPDDAQSTISFIRGVLTDLFSDDVSSAIRILYGGSMKAGNTAALIGQTDIDGGLIGGASLDAAEFAALVKACA